MTDDREIKRDQMVDRDVTWLLKDQSYCIDTEDIGSVREAKRIILQYDTVESKSGGSFSKQLDRVCNYILCLKYIQIFFFIECDSITQEHRCQK